MENESFWEQADKTGECWIWTGQRRAGYGVLEIDGVEHKAHRIAWQLSKGEAPPPLVKRQCGDRACIRPEHLYAPAPSPPWKGGRRQPPIRDADSFWARVDRTADCWEWKYGRDQAGYGQTFFDGKAIRSHRLAWFFIAGAMPPPGMMVCHRCDNPPCCNPAHLFLGTALDNSRDAKAKGRTRGGAGSICAHGEGKWRIFAYAGRDEITGKDRKVSRVITGSRRDAELALARLVTEVADGKHSDTEGHTFGEVLDAWLAHKALSVQPTTLDTYRASIGYVTDHLRGLAVKKITVAQLEGLYAHLLIKGRRNRRDGQTAGLGHAAVGNVHAAIHNALELARRRGWVVVNVAGDAEVPRAPKRIPTPADQTRLPALFAAARDLDPRLEVFLRASVCAGTRRSEMHGLRWSGVDFNRSTITLREVIVRAGGEWLVKAGTKTGGARTIYVGAGTLDRLRAMFDAAFETAAACGVVLPVDAFVFTDDPAGALPWKPQTTARRFSRCAKAAGLPAKTRIHDLRALCGTHLADEGVPIPVIGQRLGHTLNSTTADVYVGRLPESDRLAAEVMERLLDGL